MYNGVLFTMLNLTFDEVVPTNNDDVNNNNSANLLNCFRLNGIRCIISRVMFLQPRNIASRAPSF